MADDVTDRHEFHIDSRDEWELKIDEQVEKFLELKHTLTFFLITAVVGTLGFTLNVFVEPLQQMSTPGRLPFVQCLAAASILGLGSAGAALLSLYYEIESYRLHLKYRYERKTFEQIPEGEQRRWSQINGRAKRLHATAFACLFVSVAFQVVLFLLLLTQTKEGVWCITSARTRQPSSPQPQASA